MTFRHHEEFGSFPSYFNSISVHSEKNVYDTKSSSKVPVKNSDVNTRKS